MKNIDATYDFIKSHIDKYKFPPTVREICDHMKFASTSTAVYYLKKLEENGKISRSNNKNRAIELIDESIIPTLTLPIIGTIAAGQPILAEETIIDSIAISENFFTGNNLFLLKIKGESMINAGIYDGDYVVVSEQSVANNGEIVACLIDNEATVKRYYKENSVFRLQPENSFMRPIYTNNLEIIGKIVGLIRNKF